MPENRNKVPLVSVLQVRSFAERNMARNVGHPRQCQMIQQQLLAHLEQGPTRYASSPGRRGGSDASFNVGI